MSAAAFQDLATMRNPFTDPWVVIPAHGTDGEALGESRAQVNVSEATDAQVNVSEATDAQASTQGVALDQSSSFHQASILSNDVCPLQSNDARHTQSASGHFMVGPDRLSSTQLFISDSTRDYTASLALWAYIKSKKEKFDILSALPQQYGAINAATVQEMNALYEKIGINASFLDFNQRMSMKSVAFAQKHQANIAEALVKKEIMSRHIKMLFENLMYSDNYFTFWSKHTDTEEAREARILAERKRRLTQSVRRKDYDEKIEKEKRELEALIASNKHAKSEPNRIFHQNQVKSDSNKSDTSSNNATIGKSVPYNESSTSSTSTLNKLDASASTFEATGEFGW